MGKPKRLQHLLLTFASSRVLEQVRNAPAPVFIFFLLMLIAYRCQWCAQLLIHFCCDQYYTQC